MEKIKAIEYLVENTRYGNEWQGAGMWEAVVNIMTMKKNSDITIEYLKKLLKEAEDK